MAKGPQRFNNPAGHAMRKLTLWTSGDEEHIGTSPTWTSGSAAPSATEPDGSIYTRTGTSTAGTVLYVSTGGGTWTAVTV